MGLIAILAKNLNIEEQTQVVLNKLKEFKEKNSGKYNFTDLGLFGSMARGEADKDSDIDIAVDFSYSTLFTKARMRAELEELLGTKVDLISLRATMLPGFKEEIMKDIIYV